MEKVNFYIVILSGDREGELSRCICDLKCKLDDILKDIYKSKIVINRDGSEFFLRVIKVSVFLFFFFFAHLSFKSFTDSKKNFMLKILLSYYWNECLRQLLGEIQGNMKSIFQPKIRQNETRILACRLPSHIDGYLAHWYTCTHGCPT